MFKIWSNRKTYLRRVHKNDYKKSYYNDFYVKNNKVYKNCILSVYNDSKKIKSFIEQNTQKMQKTLLNNNYFGNLYELKRKLNKLYDSLESAKNQQKNIKKRRRDLKIIQQELKDDYEKFIEEYGLNFDRNMSTSIENILTTLDKEEEKGKILIRKQSNKMPYFFY